MADVADGLVVVCELMSGTRLLSVMRVRRTLPAAEAQLVLRPVAEALDEAAAAGMKLPHVGLRDVFLQPEREGGTPLGQWPDLRVAVDLLPLAEAREADLNATVVGRSVGGVGSVACDSSGHDAASMVAALAYEMLGGTTAPSAGHYVPLPELSESANRTLRRVFEDGGGLTASALLGRLLGEAAAPPERPVATGGAVTARPWSPAAPAPRSQDSDVSPAPPPKSDKGVWVAAGVGIALATTAGIGLGLYFAGGTHDRQASAQLLSATPTPPPATPAPTPPPTVEEHAPETRTVTAGEATDAAHRQDSVSSNLDGAEAAKVHDGFEQLKQSLEGEQARQASSHEPPPINQQSPTPEAVPSEREGSFEGLLSQARQGNAQAIRLVATAYLNGWPVAQDWREASRWYAMLADQGDAEAITKLGVILWSEESPVRDQRRATQLFLEGAKLNDPEAVTFLAESLLQGYPGKEPDPQRAVKLLLAAAQQKNLFAIDLLGWWVLEGVAGIPADPKKARQLFQEAWSAGHAPAAHALGFINRNGRGVPKDPAKAREFYRMAAQAGFPAAQNTYGILLSKGIGGPMNEAEAVDWFSRAAKSGDKNAKSNLRDRGVVLTR